ncbi:protein kinase [Myxococcaceae bacterium GXIMD 01537]
MKGELLAGRYQLEQELGRGGMATVYLATDLRLARRVAVKLMHPGEDARRAERFRREAELVASLKHPNVLEVHDFGEDAERGPFLVTEWVQGETLRELARRLAPVPTELAGVLGWELARALGAAHARGVVHRDVKPENVLVARGGPLKLADFGIAALSDQERLTSTGAITGSLPYMAPERIDTGAFSPASDVYAVGVILFELCAGATPHGGKGAAHLAASVMTRDAPSLAEAVPGTPEPLAALVARCLERDARLRPRDGVELERLLEEVVARVAGPPAEVSRAFFQDPEGAVARRREARFQQWLDEGRALLARGEGARAAKVLNLALTLRPGSPEVLALLRERPVVKRSRARTVGAALAGLAAVGGGVWAWGTFTGRVPVEPEAPEVAAATPGRGAGVAEGGAQVPDARPGTGGDSSGSGVRPSAEGSSPPADVRAGTEGGAPVGEVRSDSKGDAGPHAEGSGSESEARADAASTPPRDGRPQVSPVRGAGNSRNPTRGSTRGEPRPGGSETTPIAEPPPVAAAPSTSPAAPTNEPARPATLKLTTRPWAEILVDGQSRGYTPRVREVSLSPGPHRLRFVNPLCDAVEEDVTVAPGETLTREVTLQVRKAEVVISAPPGATVFIDGAEAGVAPLPGTVNVDHGRHVITARVPGAATLRREVDVVAGKRTEVVLGGLP